MFIAPFDAEGLAKALMIFILRPWEGACDVEYDARSGYLKNLKAWNDPETPVNFHAILPVIDSHLGTPCRMLVRHAPNTTKKLKKAIGLDPGFVRMGDVLKSTEKLDPVRELVEYVLAASAFKCERDRSVWIPRSFDCRECPHNLVCLTKGWEINLVP